MTPEHLAKLQAGRAAAGERAAPETNPILRYRKNHTLRRAVTAMCAHCMGCTDDGVEPGFRKDIRECSSKTCPLWAHRPFQRAPAEGSEESEEDGAPCPG